MGRNQRAAVRGLAALFSFLTACAVAPEPSALLGDAGAAASVADCGIDCVACRDDQCIPEPPPGPHCGDGVRGDDEACDDGNQVSGDGCKRNCLSIEPGFSCFPAGQACRPIARCGDGVVTRTEACDDGNRKSGDGCSERCKLELGFKCSGQPSHCEPTVCGDGKREGAEGCDDDNATPFDGCSAECQSEPDCSRDGCASRCGDGLVLDEACDDGNHVSGDGCSADCEVEQGFTCTTDESCLMQDGKCIMRVGALYHDFDDSHPDFEVGCGELKTGVVADRLDDDGLPVLASGDGACITSKDTFRQWYRANTKNASIPGQLTLYEDGQGGFVNRYGAAGEKWLGPINYTNVVWGGAAGSGCDQCTPSAQGKCFDPCTPWNNMDSACCGESSQQSYDGNPLFFPIDDAPGALPEMHYRAKIPEQYGYNGWPWEDSVIPDAKLHNFHFTTEVVTWFRFDPNASATLEFLGDDDVWVFVNRKLAVDLGGPHVPTAGSVALDASSAARFDLKEGKVYEMRVFHAERKREGSSFKLTLNGFNMQPSECTPICGDGIVTAGEECDDGVNDGGYEECAPGCVLGPSCGDGIVQEGEQCDDGNRLDGDGCGSSCRNIVLL